MLDDLARKSQIIPDMKTTSANITALRKTGTIFFHLMKITFLT